MIALTKIVSDLNSFFDIASLKEDSLFNEYLPKVYEKINFDWQNFFLPSFKINFNGLMLGGSSKVLKVWCISFPTDEVIGKILERANTGDLIFSHHPINTENGDPRGKFGLGFLPISTKILNSLKQKEISFYSCHTPMDCNEIISPALSLARLMKGNLVDDFRENGIWTNGVKNVGKIITIPETHFSQISLLFQKELKLPYVEEQNRTNSRIKRVAIFAGGMGNIKYIKEAYESGADCLVAGEISCKISGEQYEIEREKIKDFSNKTNFPMIGISHAGSEYLVMRDEMTSWFKSNYDIEAESVPQDNWWY